MRIEQREKIDFVRTKTIRNIYIAEDGNEFDKEEDCITHEIFLKMNITVDNMYKGSSTDIDGDNIDFYYFKDEEDFKRFKYFYTYHRWGNYIIYSDDITSFPILAIVSRSDGGDYRDSMYLKSAKKYLSELNNLVDEIEEKINQEEVAA